jgi:hypothetical protein
VILFLLTPQSSCEVVILNAVKNPCICPFISGLTEFRTQTAYKRQPHATLDFITPTAARRSRSAPIAIFL